MADRTVSVKLKADISDYTASLAKAAAATRGMADNVEKTVDRDLPPVLQRSGDKAGGVLAQGINAGLIRNSPLIAAAVGAALAAGAPVALAGAAVLFGGIGALAAAQTQQVRDSWTDLGTYIRDSAVQDAGVLVPVYTEMADKIGAAFARMRPEIRDAFEASAPLIERFTSGITGAANNALPGLVRAVEAGGPVIDGLATLMEDVGTGLTGFLDGMSDNSAAAGEALEGLGDVLGVALPLLGDLLGTGTELAADVLPPLASALGVVADVAAGLGPVLPMIVTGFVAMKVATTVSTGVASLAASLTSFSMASGSAATGATMLARALPMVALATAGLAIQQHENTGRVERYTKALQEGGAAAAAVRAEAENQANSGVWERFWQAFTPDDEHDIEEDLKKAEDAVRDVGGAQADGVVVSGEWKQALTGAAAEASTVTVEQAEEAKLALESWRTELQTIGASFVDPLNTYRTLLEAKTAEERKAAQATADMTVSTKDSWRDYVDYTKVTLDELAAKLEEQIAAQENWRTNIVTITQRGGLEVGQAIAAMGEEGVQLAAQMATGTDAEFQRMAAAIVTDTRLGGAGAAAELDHAMKIMAAAGASGGAATVQSIASQLQIGVGEVSRIANQYGIQLAGGINPILGALGKPNIHMAPTGKNIGYAEGGYTGPGGKYTPAGIVHAGEFVLTKEQTERLGVDRIEQFANNGYANGGFVTSADVPRPPSTAPYGVPISTAGDATMQKGYDDVAAWVAANAEPPAASGGSSTGLLPIMAAARQYAMDTYGIRNIGGFANRNIAGTNVKSDHAMGKAIDIMTTNLGLGWQIANDFATGPAHSKFRAENVIWQQSISSNGGRFVGMADRGSPTQNHRDHVHVDTYQTGTPHVPRDGLAYLHEGEAVVPAAINARSREFSGGGRSGGGGATNVTVQARVFVGNREITDIARVEATTVVVDALTGSTNRGRNNS